MPREVKKLGAWENFLDEPVNNYQIYAHNQERINQGGTVANNAFENPTFDYEVCFVAGTQILMADGSTKPIEEIRPGDSVLAAHHLTPEEKPAVAKVVRFFDNGEKDVVKLIFSGRDAEPEEFVCTPNHRFYVIGKGWVCANDLQLGDFCLSANGERIAFLSSENLDEKQRVYNFEVEEKHTYFVGVYNSSTLVHNECPVCHGDVWKLEEYTDGFFNFLWGNVNTRFVYRECICSKPFSHRIGIVQYADKDYIENIDKSVPVMEKWAYSSVEFTATVGFSSLPGKTFSTADDAIAYIQTLKGHSSQDKVGLYITVFKRTMDARKGANYLGKLSKINKRAVYQFNKRFYAIDTQHGHIEVFDKNGFHLGVASSFDNIEKIIPKMKVPNRRLIIR